MCLVLASVLPESITGRNAASESASSVESGQGKEGRRVQRTRKGDCIEWGWKDSRAREAGKRPMGRNENVEAPVPEPDLGGQPSPGGEAAM